MKNLKSFMNFRVVIFCFIYLVLSYIATGIFFQKHVVFEGNDVVFHLNRVLGLENIFNSPINLQYYNGVASQVNNFYGWLTIYPMYLLIKLFKNMALGYNLYLFLLTFATFLSMHFATFRITKNNRIAFIAAILYGFSTYRFIDIVTRSAFGEGIGMTILPIVFLGVYLILQNDKRGTLTFSFGLSLLLYTHVLTAFMAMLFVLLVVFIFCINKKNDIVPVFMLFIRSGILTFFLSLGQLVPLVLSSSYQKLSMPAIPSLSGSSFELGSHLLIKGFDNSLISVTLGIIFTFLLVAMLFSFNKLDKFQQYCLLLGIFAFILSSKLFPWELFQDSILKNIQFPWRFLGLATLFLSFSGSIYIYNFTEKLNNKNWGILCVSIVVILFTFSSIISSKQGLPHSSYSKFNSKDFSSLFYSGQVDYSPIHTEKDTKQLLEKYITINGKISNSNRKVNGNKQLYNFNSTDKSVVVLPVFKYQGLVITNNGHKIDYKKNKPLITFISVTGKNNIEISYKYPVSTKLGWLVSLVSFITVVVLMIKQKLRIKKFFRHKRSRF